MTKSSKSPYPRILIIAGSDSGGGAGIQADIKTCAAFGVYSATAITAITAQNTLGVQAVEALSPALVTAQIKSVLTDIGADVVKIGMLANREIIDAVADALEQYAPEASIVLDPVMVATSGDRLLDENAVEALKSRLIPMAEVITPNVPEAVALTGLPCSDLEELQAAGHALIKMGAFSALMKGGHLDTGAMMHDLIVTEEGTTYMSGPKIRSRHTHGTGCTLASALACGLAAGASLEDAAQAAKDFVYDAIKTAPKLGSGGKGTHGPLNHGLKPL
ncbi:bifunctional hydroxymethylpyrimidine kinase/phosphomethylpyrimidine kinase [Robiginitomaculum antarcticum]|uniref:bifunctional hydroxymethylpyrimidine kinase/phosphomethylpyrimidine kinase n=1 Tax=Robiginitomaculum antarcticum TaxID=437507 RepID=UPI00035C388B|nr:bifunctional hydroxymethylpyrimidine kinase/phosphomethylpyrimidine kinase [Robiginitomaculum antarcticum]